MPYVVQYGPAAAFYILAMAAQLSDYHSSSAALILAVIATVLLIIPGGHHARKWHNGRREIGVAGLDSWYFIAPCLMVAILAIASAAYGIGLRSANGIHAPDSKTDVPQPRPSTAAGIKSAPAFLKNISISSHSLAPLAFVGTVSATTDRLRFYVDASPRFFGQFDGTFRAQISESRDAVKDQPIDVQLVFKGPPNNTDRGEYYWGDPKNNYPIAPLNRARLVIIGPDGSEQHVYFMVIHGAVENQPFIVLDEKDNEWTKRWKEADAK